MKGIKQERAKQSRLARSGFAEDMHMPTAIIEGERNGCREFKPACRRANDDVVLHRSAPAGAQTSLARAGRALSWGTKRAGGGCRPLRAIGPRKWAPPNEHSNQVYDADSGSAREEWITQPVKSLQVEGLWTVDDVFVM